MDIINNVWKFKGILFLSMINFQWNFVKMFKTFEFRLTS